MTPLHSNTPLQHSAPTPPLHRIHSAIANTDIYKCSFSPQTIRDWNSLPDSLVSSAEGAEDGVAKFTSLVRARD